MAAPPAATGVREEPTAVARMVYVGGPRDDPDGSIEVLDGVPTILSVDEALGYYVRGKRLPDGRWPLTWRGLG